MLFAPLEGWRRVEVTDRRTRTDWAEVVRKLVDEDYPNKERIVLVMDNLNTHHPASLYEAFEPMEARRIAQRLEIHYTPTRELAQYSGKTNPSLRPQRIRHSPRPPRQPRPPGDGAAARGAGGRLGCIFVRC